MFKSFREACEWLLRIPGDPEPPPGDEARTQRFRAAPNYYKYLLGLWGLKTAVVFVVLLTMELGPLVGAMKELPEQPLFGMILIALPQIIVLLVLIGRLFSLAFVRLDFEKRWYLVTDRSLRLREGIVNVREMTITFANIQNISISQGPLQRLLGIADLRVDTAGGSTSPGRDRKGRPHSLHTAFFRGVDNANAIRELIQTRLRELKDSGLGDHEEAVLTARPSPMSAPALAQLLPALREVAAEAAALRATVS